MKAITCEININNYIYTGVVSVQTESSYETLTDTCKITFPRKVKFESSKITDLIKRGQPVAVELGYDNVNTAVFTGYIKKVKATIPVEIECEDEMYALKQSSFTKSYEDVTLKQLLTDILPSEIQFQCVDFTFSNLRLTNVTACEVLDTLDSDYGLQSFFRNEKLYVGLNVWSENTVEHKISFEKDILRDGNNLEYSIADDIQLKVVAKSIDDNNTTIEVEVGDKEGEQRTFYFYNKTEAELTLLAEQELEKLKYDGYRGTFTTFGEPVINHGDAINLTSEIYPERNGIYLVKSVKRNFGDKGYKQEVELDRIQS